MRVGLELWARDSGREFVCLNDGSSPQVAVGANEQLVERGCNPVVGPYGSDTTRAVARASEGRVVWNHGAAADDVQQLPGVVSVASPASGYLVALARAASGLGASRLAVLAAPGAFASFAREGLVRKAPALGVELVGDTDAADCVLLCGPVEWKRSAFASWTAPGFCSAASLPDFRTPHTPGRTGRSRRSSGILSSEARRDWRTTSRRRHTP